MNARPEWIGMPTLEEAPNVPDLREQIIERQRHAIDSLRAALLQTMREKLAAIDALRRIERRGPAHEPIRPFGLLDTAAERYGLQSANYENAQIARGILRQVEL